MNNLYLPSMSVQAGCTHQIRQLVDLLLNSLRLESQPSRRRILGFLPVVTEVPLRPPVILVADWTHARKLHKAGVIGAGKLLETAVFGVAKVGFFDLFPGFFNRAE